MLLKNLSYINHRLIHDCLDAKRGMWDKHTTYYYACTLWAQICFLKGVWQKLDEMKGVNGQSEMMHSIEAPTREMRTKRRHILLAEARVIRKTTKDRGMSASELIREDRDSR
jgi:hypothetical protein